MEKPDQDKLNEWSNDPSNWKWGTVYFNPKDKRIFPPKRANHLGWTINFANPLSVLMFLITIVLLAVLINFISRGYL